MVSSSVYAAPISYTFINPPPKPILRVGKRGRDLWQPPDWKYARPDGTFNNRYDDPGGMYDPPISEAKRFSVLYCGSRLAGCVGEVAAYLRPDPRHATIPSGERVIERGYIDQEWCEERKVASTLLDRSLVFVDVAAPGSINAMYQSARLNELVRSRYEHLVNAGYNVAPELSTIIGPDRRVTQEVARIIYEGSALDAPSATRLPGLPPGLTVAGIRYTTRHPWFWECWAIFHDRLGTAHSPMPESTFSLMDRDVLEAAAVLGLLVRTGPATHDEPIHLLEQLYPGS